MYNQLKNLRSSRSVKLCQVYLFSYSIDPLFAKKLDFFPTINFFYFYVESSCVSQNWTCLFKEIGQNKRENCRQRIATKIGLLIAWVSYRITTSTAVAPQKESLLPYGWLIYFWLTSKSTSFQIHSAKSTFLLWLLHSLHPIAAPSWNFLGWRFIQIQLFLIPSSISSLLVHSLSPSLVPVSSQAHASVTGATSSGPLFESLMA